MTSTLDPGQIETEQTAEAVPGIAEEALQNTPAAYHREPWLALAALVVLGGVSGMAYYLGFVQPYKLTENYRTPLQDLAKLSGASGPAANEWALTWIVLFAGYLLAFRFCPPGDRVTRNFRRVALAIIGGCAAFYSINMLFMYPVGAADIFDQIFRARLLSHYGLNPFITLPASIQGDPLQQYVAWRGDPSPYGPVWELLAGGTSWLAGADLWRNLVFFKLLVMLAYAASVALTYGILMASRPDWALRGTLFFAWNPLVIFEVAGNGHNDAVMIMFLLLAVYLFVLARRSAVLPAVMAGALAKFVPALLIPVFVAAIWRDRFQPASRRTTGSGTSLPVRRKLLGNFDAFSTLAIGLVASAGMALVLYAPFWAGTESVGALSRKKLFTASLPKVALDLLTGNLNVDDAAAQGLVRNTALVLTLLVVLAFSVRIFLAGDARTEGGRKALVGRTLGALYEVIFFYLAFATLWFQPWYLMWLVALTAPVARFSNVTRTVLFCIGGVANYFVWDFVWLWNHTTMRNIQITAAIAVYTLPLIYTFYIMVKPLAERINATNTTAAA